MKVVLEVRECMCIIRKSSYNDLSLHILLDICSLIVNSESHVLRRLSVKREKLNMQHASLYGMLPTIFKTLFSTAHCLHQLLPLVKSNPHGPRPRDHNFQLPSCNYNFRRNSFIIHSLYRYK